MRLHQGIPPRAKRHGYGVCNGQYGCQQETATGAHEQGRLQYQGNAREWLLFMHFPHYQRDALTRFLILLILSLRLFL